MDDMATATAFGSVQMSWDEYEALPHDARASTSTLEGQGDAVMGQAVDGDVVRT